jgi:hypothetical protein
MTNEPTSESLAAKILCYRLFKMFPEHAEAAMIELKRRELSGDNFDYEKYIKEKIEALPKSEKNDFINVLEKISKFGIV